MHGNIVTLCGMSSFVMLSEGCLFKEKSEKKEQPARREGMVSQGADMKVYLEGSERHRDAGSALRQKTTTNLFTRTVVPHKRGSRIYSIYRVLCKYRAAAVLHRPFQTNKNNEALLHILTYSTSSVVPGRPPSQRMCRWRPP